jgi:GMP reductase
VKRFLHYKDIFLIPKMSGLPTRKVASTFTKLGNHIFKVPVVPSNMKCSINEKLAKLLSENEYFYIMHRFNVDNFEFVKKANKEGWKTISISVGVHDKDYIDLENIFANNLRLDFVTIDVAHGHHSFVKNMLEHICNLKTSETYVIAGNIATSQAAEDLVGWGTDGIKVGIGQGYVCTTKDKTGFTMPMFTCIQSIAERCKVDIIADGGIRCNGDIAKAIVAGASMVMCGGMFACLYDSPSLLVRDPNSPTLFYKEYYGSASFYNKGTENNVEGKLELIPMQHNTYLWKLNEIQQDLQSAISYAGGEDLEALYYVDIGYN